MKRRRPSLFSDGCSIREFAVSDTITKSPKRPAAQVAVAKKAAELKTEGEAKRPKPYWLSRPQTLPPKPEVERPSAPERERAADRSQGPPRLLSKAEVCAFVGATYPTVWKMMTAKRFPHPRVVGGKSMWLAGEIEGWMQALPQRRLKGDPAPSEAAS
jgi:predicted DNA-binding transcriptional regulator AlpA